MLFIGCAITIVIARVWGAFTVLCAITIVIARVWGALQYGELLLCYLLDVLLQLLLLGYGELYFVIYWMCYDICYG